MKERVDQERDQWKENVKENKKMVEGSLREVKLLNYELTRKQK